MRLILDFAAHASPEDKRLVLGFLSGLSRSAMPVLDDAHHVFTFSSQSRLERATEGLSQWHEAGLMRWGVEEA